mgnify:CR=1 FL=1
MKELAPSVWTHVIDAEGFPTLAAVLLMPRLVFVVDTLTGPTEVAPVVDFLVVSAPGGQETYHIVSTEVLNALGPQGVVVNVARGSVVDEEALIAALRDGRLGELFGELVIGAEGRLDRFGQRAVGPSAPARLHALPVKAVIPDLSRVVEHPAFGGPDDLLQIL